jgi:purine catabolism regulator
VPLPTVSSLCAGLPGTLGPAAGFAAPPDEISAVHISELLDPTSYLSGGELLLTTGLSLPDNEIGCEGYVARLMGAGIAALGLGLGPSLTSVPAPLAAACRRHGLTLLVVPPAAAFLTITQAYWVARSRSRQQELADAITAHRSLVDAMVSPDPVGETLKALSRSIGAWVARLDPSGAVEHVFPSARASDAMGLAAEMTSLRAAGVHSSATFPSGDEVVAVFPLPLEDRVVGYIAVGSAEPMGPTARRLVLTAGALLSLDSVQRQRADAGVLSQKQSVATLLDMGFVEAARGLAWRAGLATLSDAVYVLVVRSSRAADVAGAVQAWTADALPASPESDLSWFVIPESHPNVGRLRDLLTDVDPQAAAVLSDAVATSIVHQVRVGLGERVASVPPGGVVAPTPSSTPADDIAAGVRRVIDHRRVDLTSTLAAYLRHRGQWDAAARDAGVHRNTVRHRMVTIRELLGSDPDDPDVAAETWLYLRGNGLA